MYRISSHYHGEKQAELRIKINQISVSEDNLWFALLLADKYDGDLLCRDRQHGQLYTVELVKTTPGTGLRQTYQ